MVHVGPDDHGLTTSIPLIQLDRLSRSSSREFTDVIGRNFRQPEQGLGYDNSPVAHMWRAMIRPAKYL